MWISFEPQNFFSVDFGMLEPRLFLIIIFEKRFQ